MSPRPIRDVIKVGVVGLGKMGVSHLAIFNAHPRVDLVGLCDASGYVRSVLGKYTGIPTYGDYEAMLREADLDAVVISTPSRAHVGMAQAALESGLHVFCEKPLTLSGRDAGRLAELVGELGLVTQVGYHNRFIGAFREVKELLDLGAIGEVSHILGEAYGPVVLKRKGATWRSRKEEGGGSLYDYAAHPIDLINWYLGEPAGVGGSVLNSIFSRQIDDEVLSTLYYPDGRSARIAVNWSDESQRKMTTRITAWGTGGRIEADRQECRAYLRGTAPVPAGYTTGWNVRYTTELTEPVDFYLRGEEYSAQIDHFVERIATGTSDGINAFASAAAADRVIEMIIADAANGPATRPAVEPVEPVEPKRRRWSARFRMPSSKPHRPQPVARIETTGNPR